VLVDTPPSLLMPDCRLIERWVDGFILVVAAHKTPRKLVAEALSLLDPAKMLGVVFNADDRPTAGYYGYGYGR
jgi:Mrp family chromosome partitioning ATPase